MTVSTTVVCCGHCAKGFIALSRRVRQGRAKFCSRQCSGARRKIEKAPNLACSGCGVDFYCPKKRHNGSVSGQLFCSRRCRDKNMPRFRARRYDAVSTASTRRTVCTRKATRHRRLVIERLEAQTCERCRLHNDLPIHEVHHLNGDHKDNRVENLQVVCPTCHRELHYLERAAKKALTETRTRLSIVPGSGVTPTL